MVVAKFQIASFIFDICVILNIAGHFIVVCHNVNKRTALAEAIYLLREFEAFL